MESLFLCGSAPKSPPLGQDKKPFSQPCFPRLPLGCSTALTARRRACSGLGRVLVPCPVWRWSSGTPVSSLTQLGSGTPHQPAHGDLRSSAQLRISQVHRTSEGLKRKAKKTEICPHFFLLCPTPCLLGLHVPTKLGHGTGHGSWDWATGKEPGFIKLIPPSEVAE